VDKGAIVHLNVSNAPALVAVPNVVGQDADTAEQQLVGLKLVPDERSAFSTKRRGTVISQTPTPATRVKQGSRVVLTVSHGRGKVAVPPVVGQTVQDATKALRRADLVPNVAQVPSSEPAGTVVAQNPKPGQKVARGSKVRLNVSKGGAATTQTTTTTATTATTATTTTTATAARVAVPNLVGQRFGPAVRRLETSGLRANVVYATSTRPRGTVTAQRPAAGTRVRRGSRVRLTVSAGANPTLQAVPDVVGQDQNSAVTALQQAGFTPVVVRRVVTNASQDGMVVEQQPAAGGQAPRGGSVAIYVGATG
jgi:serine/threonine-protein kinase